MDRLGMLGQSDLPLANHVHGLDSGDDDFSAPKGLESEHRSRNPFDGTVINHDTARTQAKNRQSHQNQLSLQTLLM
jgi:hypothetical protein